MNRQLLGKKIYFSRFCLCFYAILLLTMPMRLLFAAVFCAFLHEVFHVIAAMLFRKEIYEIEVGIFGAQIHMEPMDGWREFICLGAGPFGSLLVIFLFCRVPVCAFLGLAQGTFNLIPIKPLDGGRMLACILRNYMDEIDVNRIMTVVEMTIWFLVVMIVVYLTVFIKIGIWPLAVLVMLVIRKLPRKIPCKLS